MNGAKLVSDVLAHEGVTHAFGLPGTTLMELLDALGREPKIRYISARHEQVAAFMADGYARASGEIGVCLASRGPGAGNMATPIHNSYAESIPVLAIIGQVGDDIANREAFEELDLISVFRPMTKWAVEVHQPGRIPELLQRAIRTATGGRPRPVLFSLPLDVQRASVESGPLPTPFRVAKPEPSDDDASRALDLLSRARRPVVIVGGGATRVESQEVLTRLASVLSAPVVTTWLRKSAFPNHHANFCGSLGYGALHVTERVVEEADVVLALGCRFSEFTTKRWTLISPDTDIVQVDIDENEIGRVYPVALGIHADVHATVSKMNSLSDPSAANEGVAKGRGQRLEELKRSYQREALCPESEKAEALVPSVDLVAGVQHIVSRHSAVLVHDVHTFGPWIQRYVAFSRPNTYYGAAGGSMGWGFPAAMGIQLARPSDRVCAIVGDGSFWMVAQDLETAVREEIPVVVLVVNNFSYGNTRDRQRYAHGERYVGVFYNNPDFAAFARLLGAHGERVVRSEDLIPAIDRAFDTGRPAVIDVLQDRFEGLPADIRPPAAGQE